MLHTDSDNTRFGDQHSRKLRPARWEVPKVLPTCQFMGTVGVPHPQPGTVCQAADGTGRIAGGSLAAILAAGGCRFASRNVCDCKMHQLSCLTQGRDQGCL